MTAIEELIIDRPLRAPDSHGGSLQQPPLREAGALLDANGFAFQQASCERLGGALDPIRRRAQAELVDRAVEYSSAYLESVELPDRTAPLVLAGHQPELFHGGVWYKNFSLDAIGEQTGATCVNLLIDNDVCASPSIRVPSMPGDLPKFDLVAFDKPSATIPWESRPLIDAERFACFPDRVKRSLGEVSWNPIVDELWNHACDHSLQSMNLGQRIAAARHRLEAAAGLRTWEIPLSHICRTESFCRFAAVLIGEHDRFLEMHNESLLAYRQFHRIRSHTHPVPELHQESGWWEVPFWIWTPQNPTRRALFVSRRGREICFTDRDAIEVAIPQSDLSSAVCELHRSGIVLRPRALITTMYARLFLSSLFLHGIGGAKYDQLTNILIRRFFDLFPPEFMVLTATLKLPLSLPAVNSLDVTRLRGLIRSLRFQPERIAESSTAPGAAALVAEKNRLLSDQPPRDVSRKAWHDRVAGVNEALQPFVEGQRQVLTAELERLESDLFRARALGSREFSFCLLPDGETQELLRAMTTE